MTIAEIHEILDDENRKITLKEYQEILLDLEWDATLEASKLPIELCKFSWYNGEVNGLQLALDLSKHIKEEQNVGE